MLHGTGEAVVGTERALAERLERGEVVHFPRCPFAVPNRADLGYLLEQRLASRAHKNIGYDPHTDKVSGYSTSPVGSPEKLRRLLANFSRVVTDWMTATFPTYARGWQLDRVSYRPEEEAFRKLRLTARNDLLHVDAFPSRPTNGWRILRVFVNINPTESRYWITADPFARLLEKYGEAAGLPGAYQPALWSRLQDGVVKLFRPGRPARSEYDAFMLRFHNYIKANADFQKNCAKTQWEFKPGSAWLAITDTASHAVLRGRFAMEHSYFLSPETLALPDESPPALLGRACGRDVLRPAA